MLKIGFKCGCDCCDPTAKGQMDHFRLEEDQVLGISRVGIVKAADEQQGPKELVLYPHHHSYD